MTTWLWLGQWRTGAGSHHRGVDNEERLERGHYNEWNWSSWTLESSLETTEISMICNGPKCFWVKDLWICLLKCVTVCVPGPCLYLSSLVLLNRPLRAWDESRVTNIGGCWHKILMLTWITHFVVLSADIRGWLSLVNTQIMFWLCLSEFGVGWADIALEGS